MVLANKMRLNELNPISTQEKFPWTENFPKISLSANHILQNFLSAANFPEWEWTFSLT
jgi:hypothetical protein